MVFRKIGTSGPQEYTQAEANELLVDYPDFVKVGTLIRITDLGAPPGDLFMFDGLNWAPLNGGAEISAIQQLIYVAKMESSAEDGSIANPFNTIAAAVEHAENYLPEQVVVIQVMPGIYSEDVVVSRPRTIISGINGAATGTVINGSVTFNPYYLQGNNYTSIFGLDDVMVVQEPENANPAISFFGDYPAYIRIRNVKTNKTAGTNTIALSIINTSTTKTNVYLENVDFKSLGTAFKMVNANGFTRGFCALESTQEEAVNFSEVRFTFNPGSVLVSQASQDAMMLTDNSVVFVTCSSLTNNSATDGANIASVLSLSTLRLSNMDMFGATAATTPGFAVTGDGTLEYGNVTFFGNKKFSSALTLVEIDQVPEIV